MNKKIKQIYNFVGNKILNVKVNTPTDNEHPTHKKYVDDNDTYDTTLSQKPVSTKFNWVNNVNGLKIKYVLDKLLYPVVNPVYENPSFTFQHFSFETNKIIEDQIIGSMLFLTIKNADRTPINNKTTLQVIDLQNNATSFEVEENDFIVKIGFELKFDTLKEIKVRKQYNIATVKNDSDGNPFVDNNFNSTYELVKTISKKELLSIIELNILPTNYFINNFDKNSIQTFLDKNISEYTKSSEFSMGTYSETTPLNNTFLCLVHPDMISRFFSFIGYTSNNLGVSVSLENNFINYSLIDNDGFQYTKNINGINYLAISFDFGKNTEFRKYKIKLF